MTNAAVANIEVLPEMVVGHVLVDRFDEEMLRRMQGEIRSAADSHPGVPFVLDMATLSYISSMSLAALIRTCSEFRSRQQRFILAAMQPQVREVILVTRLDRLFELQDDVTSARRAVETGS